MSRIEEMSAATLGERASFEQERRPNASKSKAKLAVKYRDDGGSGFSDYEWEEY